MTTIRTNLATLAIASTALGSMAGCGGSKGLSRAELITKGDAVCKRANDALHASKMSPSRLSKVAPGIAATFAEASHELARLTPPSSMAADWKVIVDGFRTAGEGFASAGKAAKANSSRALLHAEGEISTGQDNRTVTAERNGFHDCAEF